jgi:hypothetical protein
LESYIPLEVHLPGAKKWFWPVNNSNRAMPLTGLRWMRSDLRKINDPGRRIKVIHRTIERLNVEQNQRYRPDSNKTYCNIYAYDLACCLGSYIPRVWWNDESIEKIIKGEKETIIYGRTVFELNANALTGWFENYGALFSWQRFFDLTEMQYVINNGSLGIVVAKARDVKRRGHITAVIPERGLAAAKRDRDIVLAPLQSQAGAENNKYFNTAWWTDPEKFSHFSFWVWDISK